MTDKEKRHWADLAAERVIKIRGVRKKYNCASGISPSGVVHIGNLRELITMELVAKALKAKKKNPRAIHYWDDYDRFRKVPSGIPKDYDQYIGMPLSDVPDPFKCHESYAEHFSKEAETSIKELGFEIEIIKQSELYRQCKYASEIRKVLDNKNRIIGILNKYRKEPLPSDWMPISLYCEKCKKDFTKILDYDGNYSLTYECDCGFTNKIDFRKKGIVKLPWRIQWPAWWFKFDIDFEAAGKDHYAAGGSRITGEEIIEKVWNKRGPHGLPYDFIIFKGLGGKISSSLGNVITLKDCLEIYEPEIVRFLFAGTRPNTEFAISFDLDVIKIYEDFDRLEEKYYTKKADERDKRIYELSSVNLKKTKPKRIGFRHLTMLVQIHNDIKKVSKNKDILKRAECARNWIEKYAPDEFKFRVHEKIPREIIKKLDKKQKKSLKLLKESLKKKFSEQELFNEFYDICKKVGIENKEFFKGDYLALIGKEKGPRLASFIFAIGKEKVIKLLKEIK